MKRKVISKIMKAGSAIYIKDQQASDLLKQKVSQEEEPVNSATSMWNNFNY